MCVVIIPENIAPPPKPIPNTWTVLSKERSLSVCYTSTIARIELIAWSKFILISSNKVKYINPMVYYHQAEYLYYFSRFYSHIKQQKILNYLISLKVR